SPGRFADFSRRRGVAGLFKAGAGVRAVAGLFEAGTGVRDPDYRLSRAGRASANFPRLGGGLHQTIVQPVFRLWLAMGTFALRDFVFVMGKNEVQPAAVDVERLAENSHAHRRAFDVPAGATFAPRTIPSRLTGLGTFPKSEIAG